MSYTVVTGAPREAGPAGAPVRTARRPRARLLSERATGRVGRRRSSGRSLDGGDAHASERPLLRIARHYTKDTRNLGFDQMLVPKFGQNLFRNILLFVFGDLLAKHNNDTTIIKSIIHHHISGMLQGKVLVTWHNCH